MTDVGVQEVIRRLVSEEHDLRAEHEQRVGDPAEQVRRLKEVSGELDQCWDLLRQRRALRAAGRDPGAAEVRPVTRVQTYFQ